MKKLIKSALLIVLAFSVVCICSCGTETPLPPDDPETTVPDTTAPDTEVTPETQPIKPDPPLGGHNKIAFTNNFERLTFTASSGLELAYCLYLPDNYSDEYAYPTFLFLHGAGERSNDNGYQLSVAVQSFYMPKNTLAYDAIGIFPLCPPDAGWTGNNWDLGSYSITEYPITEHMAAVVELLDYIAETYSTNPNRQYVTGLSMGGYGTWDIIARYPDRFAAAAPLCGGGDPSVAESLKALPIWVFHDLDDDAVPVTGSQDMVSALEDAGSTVVKYTESQGVGHMIWNNVYRDPEFLEWMFSQAKK